MMLQYLNNPEYDIANSFVMGDKLPIYNLQRILAVKVSGSIMIHRLAATK